MTIFSLMLAGIIPAVLVVLGGWLVLHGSTLETASRRFLIYLFIVGDGLFLIVFLVGLGSIPGDQLSMQASWLSLPTGISVMTLIFTRIKALKGASRKLKILALFLGLGNLGLLLAMWKEPNGWVPIIFSGALLLAGIWMLANRFGAAPFLLGLVSLVSMAGFNSGEFALIQERSTAIIRSLLPFYLFIFPGLVIASAASLIHGGLKRIDRLFLTPETTTRKRISIVLRLFMGASLLAYLAFTFYWVAMWDQTSDGFGQVLLLYTACPIAIGAGILMGMATHGHRRLAGLGFSVLVPLLLIGVGRLTWGAHHTINEQRATTIQAAVESFHAHNDRYPAALNELVPRELLWIPDLIILRGETWCYQGETDTYQLGAVYRENFASPLSYRIYASAGISDPEPFSCEKRLEALKALYDPRPVIDAIEHSSVANQPTLPPSQVSIPRTSIQPLVKATSVQLGSWSPNSQYFLFGLPEISGKQILVSLDFLDSKTGQLCATHPKFTVSSDLHDRYAWLPEGRLLFLSADGDLVLVTPCQPTVETLTARYPETFTQILTPMVDAHLVKHEKILLKSAQAYWLLDSDNLQVQPIPDVSPTPSNQQQDAFSWSLAGDRLAISQHNRDPKKPENTIFIISTDHGDVVQHLTLSDVSSNNLSSIEWLSDHELLASVQDTLSIIDLQASPPKVTNVFKDLFSLNIAFPGDISSLTTVPDLSGRSFQLAVRINHPRNQSIYVYHSESGKVDILHPDANALLFFSGGNWAELNKLENMNNLQDTFELFWPDDPAKASQRLNITGHIPRNYPMLFLKYLVEKSQILVSSSQGISRVSIPDGRLLNFWELTDQKYHMQPSLLISPDHHHLVAIAEGDGIYTIALGQ